MDIFLLFLIIIYSVLLIGAFNASRIYIYQDLGINRYFLIIIISALLLVFGPIIIKKSIQWADSHISTLNVDKMKQEFFEQITGENFFSIDEIAENYDIDGGKVKDYIFELVEKGFLRGKIEKTITGSEIFHISPGFLIESPEEYLFDVIDEELEDFLLGYSQVSIYKIAKYFGISSDKIERILKNKIKSGEIEGYIEEDTFIRDWPDFMEDFSKMMKRSLIKCSNCANETDGSKPFCYWCGKKIVKNVKETD